MLHWYYMHFICFDCYCFVWLLTCGFVQFGINLSLQILCYFSTKGSNFFVYSIQKNKHKLVNVSFKGAQPRFNLVKFYFPFSMFTILQLGVASCLLIVKKIRVSFVKLYTRYRYRIPIHLSCKQSSGLILFCLYFELPG